MDELHRRRQQHVMRARVAEEPRRREGQHRADPLAPGLHEMRRHLRDARRVLRRHALADQRIDALKVLGKIRREAILRFLRALVQTHRSLVGGTRQPPLFRPNSRP